MITTNKEQIRLLDERLEESRSAASSAFWAIFVLLWIVIGFEVRNSVMIEAISRKLDSLPHAPRESK